MEGTITAKMVLNISDLKTKLDQAEAKLRAAIAKVQNFSSATSRAMAKATNTFVENNKKAVDKLVADSKGASNKRVASNKKAANKILKDNKKALDKLVKINKKAADKYSRSWWDSFGRVAIGFTIAYRAMNAFEVGIQKVIETIKGAITESSELAATQAKLAFWYTMHTKESITYAEAFERAAVNIRALGAASIYSVASLEEITTGMDELAQSVGAVPAKMIPAMASMVDFTVMVAQTTGSTIRQVRQEFQALMEGRIRTTDVMARSLIKTGIMSRKELKQMRNMTNQAEILNKIMNAVHERWTKARDIYREASIEAAKGFWEKALRLNIRLSIELASEMTKTGKVAGNLFARTFVEHGKRITKYMEGVTRDLKLIQAGKLGLKDLDQGFRNNIITMITLQKVLDSVLTAFEKTLTGVVSFIAALYRLSDEVIFAAKALGGLLIVSVITKLMTGLGKAVLWLALGPMKILLGAVKLLNTAVLRIPLLLYASVVAVQAFFKTMGMSGKYLKDIFLEIPRALKGIFSTLTSELGNMFASMGSFIWDLLPAPIQKIINWIVEKIGDAAAVIKEKVKDTAGVLIPVVEDVSKKVTSIFSNVYDVLKTDGIDFAQEFGRNFKDTVLGHVKVLEKLLAPVWAKLSDDSKETYQKLFADIQKAVQGLEWTFKEGREATQKEIDAEAKRLRKLLALRIQIEKDFYKGRLQRIQEDADAEYQIRLLKIEELARTKAEKDELEILAAQAHAEKVLVIHGTMTDGLIRGILEYCDTVKTSFEITRDYVKQIFTDLESSIQTTFGDVLYDAFTGQLKSIQDYYKAFALSFTRAWSNMIAELIVELMKLAIMKQILAAAGGGGFWGSVGTFVGEALTAHKGGVVGETSFPMKQVPAYLFNDAVRLHSGLAPDEFPAILQRGETVLPKDSSKTASERVMQVDIVNVWDDTLFDRYLASARGQDALINTMGSRPQSFRRLLR